MFHLVGKAKPFTPPACARIRVKADPFTAGRTEAPGVKLLPLTAGAPDLGSCKAGLLYSLGSSVKAKAFTASICSTFAVKANAFTACGGTAHNAPFSEIHQAA